MSNRVKNLKSKILSNKFFTLSEIQFDYQLKSGKWVKNTWEVLDRGNAAAALLYNPKKGIVLLVKQFRLPVYMSGHKTGFLLEVPAGTIDKNDTSAEETMKRELLEETGYKVPKLTKVLSAFATPGGNTERFSCYVGEYTAEMKVEKGGGLESENEDIEVVELQFSEALEMIKNEEIVDAKTIMLLQHAQINNLIPAKAEI